MSEPDADVGVSEATNHLRLALPGVVARSPCE